MTEKRTNPVDKLIVVGDRVLIKPKTEEHKTRGGLLLPPGYKEKEEIQSGYVVKTGPGYPIPAPTEEMDEPWKHEGQDDPVHYIPLQARVGDLAIFLKKGAVEIRYNNKKYFIVPQHSILLLERDNLSFE
jgi:co-chaperonin GroES (HSP10)